MQNQFQTASFADLFKKYRLRSQINTLAQFANLLAEEGMVYENSLFSRWQSGDRVPHDRKTIIAAIHVFAKQGGIRNIEQANEILASADQLPCTEEDASHLHPLISNAKPSVNELVEYSTVEYALPIQAIDLINLTVSAMNHTIMKDDGAKTPSLISRIVKKAQKFNINRSITFLCSFYIVLTLWSLAIYLDGSKTSYSNTIFGGTYALLPIAGGLFGINSSNRWGGKKSSMGRALHYLSLGLMSWGFGNIIWAFYAIVLRVDVPYPSFADVPYMTSWPLWGIGIHHLSKASGINFQLKKKLSIIPLVSLPIIMIIFSYYLIILIARGGSVVNTGDLTKAFFDLGYPFLDAVLVAEIFLTFGFTFKQVQKKYRAPLSFLLVGILINYIADFVFSYSTTNGTFYDGSWMDMLFPTAMCLIGVAVNSFEAS